MFLNRHSRLLIQRCSLLTTRYFSFGGSFSSHSSATTSKSSVDKEDVAKFSRLAQHWWNETGEFAALHTLNRLRVPLIRDGVNKKMSAPRFKPLEGLMILDVGCGGGILSEPLARLGAEVTGVDASEDNILTAQWHSQHDPALLPRLRYLNLAVEDLSYDEKEQFDAVVMSEIFEHVADQTSFLSSCCSLVKPGGSVFLTTINKTRLSYLLAIVAAERIFRIVPEGIHDWNKFISPQDLESLLQNNFFSTRLIHGMTMNPLNLTWYWCRDSSVNYALHAVKEGNISNENDS